MSDHARRETSLLMGVGIFVALVALAFFGVTMAWREAAQRRARSHAAVEQLRRARQQATQHPSGEALAELTGHVRDAAQLFVTSETLPAAHQALEAVAATCDVALAFQPSLTPATPSTWIRGFEGCYDVMPLVVTLEGRYRGVAEFLTRATALMRPVLTLQTATISPLATFGEGRRRLKARVVLSAYVWRPGAFPKGLGSPPSAEPPAGTEPAPPPERGWGRDPFDPRYVPTPQVEGIVLNGILWDTQHPTCVLNGMVLGIGGVVNGYVVAIITQTAVVLRGDQELVLAVSP